MQLEIGNPAPQFEAEDESGNPISNDDLLGSVAVIYFYPKDDTPGCTKEACDFRDNILALDEKGIIVLGISPDNGESHRRFAEKYSLNFGLIADPTKKLCKAFGVLKTKIDGTTGLERSTFVIDDRGTIRWIERPVQVEGHVHRILKALDDLKIG